jgi:hypothetical protein
MLIGFFRFAGDDTSSILNKRSKSSTSGVVTTSKYTDQSISDADSDETVPPPALTTADSPPMARLQVTPLKTRIQSQKQANKQQIGAETIDTTNNNTPPNTDSTFNGDFYGFSRLIIEATAIVNDRYKDLSNSVQIQNETTTKRRGKRIFKQRNTNQVTKRKVATKRSQTVISPSAADDHFVAQCVSRTGPMTRSRQRRDAIADRNEFDISKPTTQAPPQAKKMRK